MEEQNDAWFASLLQDTESSAGALGSRAGAFLKAAEEAGRQRVQEAASLAKAAEEAGRQRVQEAASLASSAR